MMMVFIVFFGFSVLLGFVGNFFVLFVVILYCDFWYMCYFLLVSLVFLDWIFVVLVVGSCIMVNVVEKWIFGIIWCYGVVFIIWVFYYSICFYLCVVFYEWYDVIVRRLLNYNSCIIKKRVFFVVVLLWILLVFIFFVLFFGLGDFIYNLDIFVCE